MTKEETLTYLKAYLNGDTAIGNIIPLRSVLESALEYLELSLPSNLDEAAEEYAKETFIKECIKNGAEAFKAGAEWMAGQGGVTKDGLVAAYDNGCLRVYTTILDKEDGIKLGDKVIVQIRKK